MLQLTNLVCSVLAKILDPMPIHTYIATRITGSMFRTQIFRRVNSARFILELASIRMLTRMKLLQYGQTSMRHHESGHVLWGEKLQDNSESF